MASEIVKKNTMNVDTLDIFDNYYFFTSQRGDGSNIPTSRTVWDTYKSEIFESKGETGKKITFWQN